VEEEKEIGTGGRGRRTRDDAGAGGFWCPTSLFFLLTSLSLSLSLSSFLNSCDNCI
jgi:hypothetical protein